MPYRKGELTARAIARDWPIAIVIEREIWGTMIHLMGRHVAPRSRGMIDRNGNEHLILYLHDPEIAERIRAFSDGHYFDQRYIVETDGKSVWEPPGLPRPPRNRYIVNL